MRRRPPKKKAIDRKIDKLRKDTVEADSFSDPFNYFFDINEDYPDYMTDGKKKIDDNISQLIGEILSSVLGKDGFLFLERPMMFTLEKHSLVHGTFMHKGKMIVFYFFKDINVGIMAVQMGGETKFARISAMLLGGDGDMHEKKWGNPPPTKIYMN